MTSNLPDATRLAEIAARVEKATIAGEEWFIGTDLTPQGFGTYVVLSTDLGASIATVSKGWDDPAKPKAIAELISHSPTDMKWLLHRLALAEELAAMLASLTKAVATEAVHNGAGFTGQYLKAERLAAAALRRWEEEGGQP